MQAVTELIRQKRTIIDAKRAAALLYPLAAFLHAGGMSKKGAIAAFTLVFERVLNAGVGRRMEHIGHPTPYADIVAIWARTKPFLDSRGWPRALPFKGRTGFASLVRSVSREADPKAVLAVLTRYGNVRRLKNGAYTLTRSFFYASGPKTMAYEPVAYFLSDASATLSRILKRSNRWRGPDLFWQKAERARISEATAKRFTAYAKERCLVFLDEMDDWLEAHSDRSRKGSRQQHRRIGLGIFSIYSDREDPGAGF